MDLKPLTTGAGLTVSNKHIPSEMVDFAFLVLEGLSREACRYSDEQTKVWNGNRGRKPRHMRPTSTSSVQHWMLWTLMSEKRRR
jgi:hypothetical protein